MHQQNLTLQNKQIYETYTGLNELLWVPHVIVFICVTVLVYHCVCTNMPKHDLLYCFNLISPCLWCKLTNLICATKYQPNKSICHFSVIKSSLFWYSHSQMIERINIKSHLLSFWLTLKNGFVFETWLTLSSLSFYYLQYNTHTHIPTLATRQWKRLTGLMINGSN